MYYHLIKLIHTNSLKWKHGYMWHLCHFQPSLTRFKLQSFDPQITKSALTGLNSVTWHMGIIKPPMRHWGCNSEVALTCITVVWKCHEPSFGDHNVRTRKCSLSWLKILLRQIQQCFIIKPAPKVFLLFMKSEHSGHTDVFTGQRYALRLKKYSCPSTSSVYRVWYPVT